LTRSHSDHSRDHSVDLETCTAEVSSNDRAATDCSVKDTVRKDPAVHVSLSSDSLVKQPGTKAIPSPFVWGAVEAHTTDRDRRWVTEYQ